MKEQEIRKALAGKLREFRTRANLTAKEVGEKLGKSAKTVSGWEHGRGQPDADTLFELCAIYGITNIGEFYSDAPSVSVPGLTDDEEELIALYRSLNAQTRAMLLATARGFAGNPDLQKGTIQSETA